MFHKVIITLLKPLSFLPALLVMYMIFSFSAQIGTESGNLSFQVSEKLVEVGAKVLDKDLTNSEIEMYANKYHHYVRKLGHMTEYCVLAITLCVPLYAYGVRGSGCICWRDSYVPVLRRRMNIISRLWQGVDRRCGMSASIHLVR